MKAAEGLLGTAAALFAVLPGLNSILGGAGSTPGDERLFGGVSVATGVAVLLIVTILKAKIRRIARRKIVLLSVIILLLGIAVLATHIGVLAASVVQYQIDSPQSTASRQFVFPIAPSGQLASMISTAGGRLAALYRYGPDAIAASLLQGTNPLGVALTKGLLLVTFALISASFAAVLMILAYRVGSSA
jgi:hypothetical protein